MPTFLPAAIGLGSSLFSAGSGKKAGKKQEQTAQQQLALQKQQWDQLWGKVGPIADYSFGKGKEFLGGAQQGIGDLEKFWKPLMSGDRSAIDQFLAPERSAINQGYAATVGNLGRMAPRGGGRVSALAGADVKRQGALNDLVYGARRDAAGERSKLAQLQGNLGLGTLNNTNGLYGLLNGAGNRQQDASQYLSNIYGSRSQGLGGVGEALGGFLTQIFKNKGAGGGGQQGFGYGRSAGDDPFGDIGD